MLRKTLLIKMCWQNVSTKPYDCWES